MVGGSGDDVAWLAATSAPRLAHMGAGGGKQTKSDGPTFGNGWLPNIEIINNQYRNF